MKQAEKGIRFITPHYEEKFRIADGDMVRIRCPDGRQLDRECRYIDECHVEVGKGWDNLYHICQFVRLMGYMKTIGGATSLFNKWEQRKTFNDVYGTVSICYPWDKSILEDTTAENCKLDLYQDAGGKRLVSYLALWRKRPTVENLLVQGCGRFLAELIDKEKSSRMDRGGIPKLSEVNWKEKRPAQMLGLNKEEFRHMRRMGWSAEDLERYRLVKKVGIRMKLPEDMELLKTRLAYDINLVLEEAPRADFWRTIRYLSRQKSDWRTLRDYRRMAAEDGRDLTDNLVCWPRKADPDTTALMVLFKGWQETYTKMWETLHRIDASDGDKGQKLRGGIRKALETALEQMA